MAPVLEFMVRPAGSAVYWPPDTPVLVTACVEAVVQKAEGAGYEILAVGNAKMVIEAVACTRPQPFAAANVLVTVYVPGLLNAKSTSPGTPPALNTKFGEFAVNTPASPPPI
jgi:hypothetical protein